MHDILKYDLYQNDGFRPTIAGKRSSSKVIDEMYFLGPGHYEWEV